MGDNRDTKAKPQLIIIFLFFFSCLERGTGNIMEGREEASNSGVSWSQ